MLDKYIFRCMLTVKFCDAPFRQEEMCLDVKIESGTDAEVQAQIDAALAPLKNRLESISCGFHQLCELCDSCELSNDE